MSLRTGINLGPYEILSPLGAGGMGEVYKAKDTRLDRLVAVKVLPEHLANNAEALARFEREAKAVAVLNHPNITALFDIGRVDDTVYAVMELLEGQTLRAKLLEGPLPPRAATELAIQMAQGLAAAHEKGVVHRDLKPDNLWISTDGRLKILDFGLAKQVSGAGSGSHSFLATEAFSVGHHTEQGMILGTMGYMSPEQVRGETVDARSDLFSFGAVLFEMLTGQRAFARDTAADTMAAILKEDPPELRETSRPIPMALRRILDHCLEKLPSRRFHDAQDLAFALENVAQGSSDSSARLVPPAASRKAPWKAALMFLGIGGLGILAGWWSRPPKPEPTLTQLSFRRGNVLNARFTPDGQSAVFAASWDGRPTELFLARLDGTATRPLGLAKADVLAINRQGQLLVLLKGEKWGSAEGKGVLAQLPLEGGAPRELLERVSSADFGPDGKELAVIHQPSEGGPQRLEYPLGKTLFELETQTMSMVRVSPQGDRVAIRFYDYPTDTTTLAVFDREGRRQDVVKKSYGLGAGPIWSLDGKELYYSLGSTLWASSLKGGERVVRRDSGLRGVKDVSVQGRFLLERFIEQITTIARREGKDTDLSHSGKTILRGLSADGQQAYLNGTVNLDSDHDQVAIRRTDGSPPKFLGPGYCLDQSPDGKWVMVATFGQTDHFTLVPTGTGVSQEIRQPGWSLMEAIFSANGRDLLLWARQGKDPIQILKVPLKGGPAEIVKAKAPPANRFTSEDGTQILTLDDQRRPVLRAMSDGAERVLAPALAEGEDILGWDLNDRIVVGRLNQPASIQLDLVDLKTGKRSPWQTVGPSDPSGVMSIQEVRVSRDFKTVAYTYRRVITSDLFVAEGLK